MLWKAIFFVLLAVVLGLLWQHEDYRNMLILEIDAARTSLNLFTSRYEGWQVVFMSCGVTLMLSCLLSFLFQDNIYTLRQRATKFCFKFVRKLPGVESKIKREIGKSMLTVEKESFSHQSSETYRTELPEKGFTHNEVMKEIAKIDKIASVEWDEGWVSGGLYYSSPELTKLTAAVFEKYVWSNPLHVGVFPQVCKMEAEVVQWTVNLFNGSEDACGVMTSGGTESIILAMRAYREVGYLRGIKYPEIVCPSTAHCAFSKAADYFRMKITLVRLVMGVGCVVAVKDMCAYCNPMC